MIWSKNQQLDNGRYTIMDAPFKTNDFISTYTAIDKNRDPVIIETLNGSYFLNLSPSERRQIEIKFTQGGITLSQCRNRHIVHVSRKPFQESGLWCIASEDVQGDNLYTLTQSPLPQNQALKYIKQLCEGLIEVHRDGLFHLNINPENIIRRSNTDEVVLIGFSFIKGTLITTTQARERYANFSPIELFATEHPPNRQSDIYSLAATLYFLLTARNPPLVTDRLLSPSLLIQQGLEIAPNVHNAICRGMSIYQQERPESIRQWLDLLEQTSNTSAGIQLTPALRNPLTRSEKLLIWGLIVTFFTGSLAGIGALLQGLGALRGKQGSNPSPTPSLVSTPLPKRSFSVPLPTKSSNK